MKLVIINVYDDDPEEDLYVEDREDLDTLIKEWRSMDRDDVINAGELDTFLKVHGIVFVQVRHISFS